MAWNYYKYVSRKVGCLLRVRALPADICAKIPEGNCLDTVRVVGRAKGRVTLQLWSYVPGTYGNRFTVDVTVEDENPMWVVERP